MVYWKALSYFFAEKINWKCVSSTYKVGSWLALTTKYCPALEEVFHSSSKYLADPSCLNLIFLLKNTLYSVFEGVMFESISIKPCWNSLGKKSRIVGNKIGPSHHFLWRTRSWFSFNWDSLQSNLSLFLVLMSLNKKNYFRDPVLKVIDINSLYIW